MAMSPYGDRFAPLRQLTPEQLIAAAQAAFRPPGLMQAPSMPMAQPQGGGMGAGMAALQQQLDKMPKPKKDPPGTITPGSITPGNPVRPGEMISTSAIDHAISQQPQTAAAMVPTGQPSGTDFFSVLARLFRS